jgi:adenylate cyclase
MSARGTIDFLIRFLTPMTDILLARRATIDKYIGDAVLAFWNAPLDDADHPRNAALAALEMIDRLATLNAANADDPAWPGEVRIGVGLNTGICCVGNMGSAQRLSYSLIGDAVNLASRLEGLTKYYGVPILVGAATAARLADFALIECDLTCVVGRETPERIYALVGGPELAASDVFRAASERQEQMLAAYRSRNWDQVEALTLEMQDDPGARMVHKLADLYRARIGEFRATPPPAEWAGVHYATEK